MLKKYLSMSVIFSFALQANAQSNFSELIVFGDSLFDSGNLGLSFTNKVGDGSGDYGVGEYAPIAPQWLANHLDLSLESAAEGGSNYAVGGYQTADIFGSIAGAGLTLPSGVVPAYLSTNSSIASDALVLIDGGGNDLRDILLNNPAEAVPDLLKASAQTLVGAIGALDGAGAKYIMVANLPDVGLSAGVQYAELGLSGIAEGFSGATQGFNTAVQSYINIGLSDANIIPVDFNGLVSFVFDNAEQYGLVSGSVDIGGGLLFNALSMCFDDDFDNNPATPADCIEHPLYGIDGATPDPSKLFYADSLHPTAIVGEIAGDYMADIILAPQKVALLPEMALSASRAQVAVIASELRQSRWGKLQGRLFVTGDVSTAQLDNEISQETESTGLSVGISHAVADNLLLGLAFSVSKQELNTSGVNFESDSFGLSGLLGYRQQRLFIEASLGLSVLSYDDLGRDVKLGSQTYSAQGSTEGHAWVVDTLVGYDLLESQKYHLAPAVGLQMINVTVKNYTESGGEISNYAWADQHRKSMQWRYGVVAGAQLSQTVALYAEVFASQEEEDDLQHIDIRNTNLNSPSYQLPSYQADGESFSTATVGASVDISESRLSFNWSYSDQGDGFDQVVLSYSLAM